MINFNEEGFMLSKKHIENGKRALIVAICMYAFFLIMLFIFRSYKKKHKLYNNIFNTKRSSPKYMQLPANYLSGTDEIEQYELSKM